MAFLTEAANRGSISTGYDIDNSCKFERANSERLTRTPSSDGNERTFTFSAWVKFSYINTGVSDWSALFSAGDQASGTPSFRIGHHTNNHLQVSFYKNGAYQGYYRTDALYRDTSAWYHYVIAVDTTQATNTNRVKIYVNGEQASTDSVVSHISQNYDSGVNRNGVINQIGAFTNSSVFSYASEYVAETHFVDGQALDPTYFGEFDDNNIWIPKQYDGTYGTNGFYLDFADASDLGDDESGNGNDFTEGNITSADQSTDTPTNNFCTMNPLDRTNGNIKTQEGATKVTTDGGSGWCSMVATMGVTKGKWYWEAQRMSTGTPNDVITGIVGSEDAYVPYSSAANYYIGNVATSSSIGYYQKNYPSQEGSVVNGVSLNFYSQGGDTIMFGLDMDNEKMYFGLNGTWKGTGDSIGGNTAAASTLHSDFDGEFVLPAVSVFQGNNMTINFGGYAAYTISSAASDADGYGTFEYAPPTGFYALCTKNLAEYG